MPERAARPEVPSAVRRILGAVQGFTTPLVPDDYLELVNPMWSTRELKAQIVEIRKETPDTASVVLRPARRWPGHRPGQFMRLGVEINGVRHWRAYTITADPRHPRGYVSVTIKAVDEGAMSSYFVHRALPGSLVYLGEVEGEFGLPDPLPSKSLFVSAGSGITPIWSLLRELDRREGLEDAIHLYSMRTDEDFIFRDLLYDIGKRHPGYQLHVQLSSTEGRLTPARIAELVPDWHEREAFLSGPGEMLDALKAHWVEHGVQHRLSMERFQPRIGGDEVEPGAGGSVYFRITEVKGECDGRTPILVGGEQAGAQLPFGCRMGVCHTCIGRLALGTVRDLRSGELTSEEGVMIRTCINCPEGDVEIDL
ncbi:MAG: ferredoxin reductase [Actinomycetota bacterium]|nr:ferredoxin reductase [Actinomycetota bacterium]